MHAVHAQGAEQLQSMPCAASQCIAVRNDVLQPRGWGAPGEVPHRKRRLAQLCTVRAGQPPSWCRAHTPIASGRSCCRRPQRSTETSAPRGERVDQGAGQLLCCAGTLIASARPYCCRPQWSTPEEVARRVRYVHDELGSRIRFPAPGGPPPGFQLAPFLWRHSGRQEALSILWPIRCDGMQAFGCHPSLRFST